MDGISIGKEQLLIGHRLGNASGSLGTITALRGSAPGLPPFQNPQLKGITDQRSQPVSRAVLLCAELVFAMQLLCSQSLWRHRYTGWLGHMLPPRDPLSF